MPWDLLCQIIYIYVHSQDIDVTPGAVFPYPLSTSCSALLSAHGLSIVYFTSRVMAEVTQLWF
jgi:hypothetical protein